VQQVFQKLATIENEREADELTAVLLSIRPDMKEALAASMRSGLSDLMFHAARGLAASITPQEGFLLYAYLFCEGGIPESERETVKNILQRRRIAIPTQEQAAKILFDRATDYFERRRPLRTDADGNVSFWDWDGGEIMYRSEDIETAYKYFALRYYAGCELIVPRNSAYYKPNKSALYMSLIEYERFTPEGFAIYIQPHDEYDFDNPQNIERYVLDMEQLLQMSLEKKCFHAAACFTYMLSMFDDSINADSVLKSTTGKPRTLVQATVTKDRRVRFAALEAIMNLTLESRERNNVERPDESGEESGRSAALRSRLSSSYAGSSLVADTLVWFSKSDGESVLLSGHPQMAAANQTASLLLGLGYTTDVAVSCRELFAHAAASPDVEVIVVDARMTQPPVGEFVQAMRQDARTAEIPIAVLTSDERELRFLPRAREAAKTQAAFRTSRWDSNRSLSMNYPRLASAESAQWVIDDLLDKTGANPTSPAIRLEQAKQALRWLKEIKEAELKSGVKIYHFDDFDSVVLSAMRSEGRYKEGLDLAAVVKSPAVQLALYDWAANGLYPIELRELAGQAFEQSVETFGVLLRGQQVQRMYDRYNQSEFEEKESQELLSRLIDVVEAKVER
jgi:CheY-like chemotaxis protein